MSYPHPHGTVTCASKIASQSRNETEATFLRGRQNKIMPGFDGRTKSRARGRGGEGEGGSFEGDQELHSSRQPVSTIISRQIEDLTGSKAFRCTAWYAFGFRSVSREGGEERMTAENAITRSGSALFFFFSRSPYCTRAESRWNSGVIRALAIIGSGVEGMVQISHNAYDDPLAGKLTGTIFTHRRGNRTPTRYCVSPRIIPPARASKQPERHLRNHPHFTKESKKERKKKTQYSHKQPTPQTPPKPSSHHVY